MTAQSLATKLGRTIRPVLLMLFCLSATPAAAGLEHFITVRGDQFMEGDQQYRFISFNIPNLLVIEDAFEYLSPNPWRWPNEFEITDALESVRQMGGQVARTYVISIYREGADMAETVHVRRPGEFNEEGFKALDKVLDVANRKGVRIIIPLVDNWRWMGGVPQYAAFRDKPAEAFWSDPELIADFKKTIRYVVNRKNTYTGRRYRDEPAVFGWETGNEIDATPDWTRQIAAYIKQLDPNHLVIDGRSLHGISAWQLDEPNSDVLSTHHYPGRTNDFVPLIREAHAKCLGRKPYFVGEFGFVEKRFLTPVVDAVVEDGIPGALLWSLRFHRREGGFYWHMEVGSGRNIYKAYHWPGFDSGAAYEERQMLDLMRRKAFEIRSMELPAIEPPAPPTLLPIEHPAKISWQGSVGAASYDVLRAGQPAGPWTTIGRDVSDAAVQYRPLFSDPTAEPGQAYYYRVVARNSGGDSDPSNTIGPIEAGCRMLVDECADLSLLHAAEGDVSVASANARRTQEDIHRLAMPAGSAIVYRVSQPIRCWRVFAFAQSADVQPTFETSTDGKSFTVVQAERQLNPAGRGDYGYLVPILYHGPSSGRDDVFLKLTLRDSAAADGTDIRADGSPSATVPLEVSRVEIDFDDRRQ